MATSRPFAYNTSSAISGTTQVGSLAVGTPTSGFTSSPQFWNGPDEDLGYVIAQSISGNTQPTPISGVTASVGFNRTTGFTNSEFVSLANRIANQSYTGATQASSGLTSLGYWNSYPSITCTYVSTAVAPGVPYLSTYTFTNFNVGGTGLIVIPIHSGRADTGPLVARTLTGVTVGGQVATIAVQASQAGTNNVSQVAIAYVNYTGVSTTPTVVCSFNGLNYDCRIASYRVLYNINNTTIAVGSTGDTNTTTSQTTLTGLGTGNKIYIAASSTYWGLSNTWSATSTPNLTERYDLTSGGASFVSSSASIATASVDSSVTLTTTFSRALGPFGATMCAVAIE
jgi:hypothetical protein